MPGARRKKKGQVGRGPSMEKKPGEKGRSGGGPDNYDGRANLGTTEDPPQPIDTGKGNGSVVDTY